MRFDDMAEEMAALREEIVEIKWTTHAFPHGKSIVIRNMP